MSMRDLIERAKSANLIHLESQESLTQDQVLPAIPELVDEITRIRRGLDLKFTSKLPTGPVQDVAGEMDPANYPVGYCREICVATQRQLAAYPLVQELQRKGVVFRQVYIILYGRYFQNAIQLGNLYIDAANDTVDPAKPFLEWMPIRELDYENLESWEQIIPVAESYFQCRVLPNHVFPLMAPLVPLMAIRNSGRIDLLFFQDHFFLQDLGLGMTRYLDWLRSGTRAAARRLAPEDLATLEREFGANDFDRFPFEFRKVDGEELAAQAEELVRFTKRKDGEAVLLKLFELAQSAVVEFKKRGLMSEGAALRRSAE